MIKEQKWLLILNDFSEHSLQVNQDGDLLLSFQFGIFYNHSSCEENQRIQANF